MVAPESWTAVKATGKRTESYRPAEGLYTVADIKLPQVTFERAGTQVATRIVVIEKQSDAAKAPNPVSRDLSDAEDINDLFDRLENMTMPERVAKAAPVEEEAPAARGKKVVPVVDTEAAKAAADAMGLDIVEHVTGKGKTIRGVIRKDLTQAQAKAIDEFTFKKDGGWFIREKHLAAAGAEATKLSRGRGAGMARRDAQAVLDRIAPTFKNLPEIHLLESPSKAALEAIGAPGLFDDIRRFGAQDDVEAAFHNGEFYVFLNNLSDEARLEHVLFRHEVRHYGFDNVLGDRKDVLLGELWAKSPAIQVKAMALKKRLGLTSNVAAVEELLADMPAEDLAKLKGWHRITLAVRDWLQAHGFETLAKQLTDLLGGDAKAADLMAADMVRQAQAYAKNGSPSGRLIRGTRLSAPDAARAALEWKSQTANDVGPVYQGDGFTLEAAKKLDTTDDFAGDDGLPWGHAAHVQDDAFRFSILDAKGDLAGFMDAEVNGLGEISAIHDMAIEAPGKGLGSKIVETIMASTYDGVRIIEALDQSKPFWNRLGAQGYDQYQNTRLDFDGSPAEARAHHAAAAGRPGEEGGQGGSRFSRAGQEPAKLTPQEIDAKVAAVLAKRGHGESIANKAVRVPTQALQLDKLTRLFGGKVRQLLDALTPEPVKAGVIADYGLPEAVTDRRDLMFGHQRAQLRGLENTLERLSTLTRQESRVAYAWMNERNADHLLASLPEDSRAVLTELKQHITDLSKEAVRLGQLDADTFERHAMAYLHRSYRKHELDATEGERVSRARAIRVLGDQYKGRGLTDQPLMRQVQNIAPDFWKRKTQDGKADKGLKGEKFIRFERRANRGEGVGTLSGVDTADQLGKLLEVQYWPASEPVPAKYGEWHEAGTWEVRDTKGDRLILWRDFTKAERERMGELDEVRFAVAKTLHQMIHDIETGKYLAWLAGNYGKRAENLPQDAKVVEAKTSMRNVFERDEWVQVPETTVPGTKVKRFGALAGLYIPGPVWNDVRQTTSVRYQPLGAAFAGLLKAWKVSKTALSPAVHLNNVMANFVMADWHDVRTGDLMAALRIVAKPDDQANRQILDRFEDAAATQGMYLLSEVQREQLAPMLEALRNEVEQAGEVQGMVGLLGAWEAVKAKQWAEIWPALTAGKAAGLTKAAVDKAMEIYQSEDVVFRLAAFLKAKGEGASDVQAGKFARRSFLDYNINAPWIQAARQSAFPFISFTYRALPMLLNTAEQKPWKLMKLALAVGALNAIGFALSGGDEDKERKWMPKEKAGRVWGIVPKLVRMPWNSEGVRRDGTKTSDPVFLDIRRFIPVGDIVDFGQEHSAIPIPPALMPGGPLALLGEIVLNTSSFTGRDITQNTDTATEKAGKVADYLYKAFAPNLIFLPGTYAFEGVSGAATGKTDVFGREQSVPMAAGSAFGLKLGAYPTDTAQYNALAKVRAEKAEIDSNIRKLGREYQRGGLSIDQYRGKVADQVDKQQKALKEVTR